MASNSSTALLESKQTPLISDWSTLPKDRILSEILTILPLVAYPFLPSASRSGIRCEVSFIWTPVLVYIYLLTSSHNVDGSADPYPLPPTWQTIVPLYSLYIGIEAILVPSSREPKAADYNSLAKFFGLPCTYGLLYCLGHNVYDITPDGYSRLACVLRLMALCLIASVLFSLFNHFLLDAAARLVFAFATRRVSWWCWLPENSDGDDFGPWWSFALAAFVVIAPLGLCLFAFYGTMGHVLA